MPNQPGTLEQIAIELANLLLQLVERLGDDELLETLAQFGIIFPPELLENATVIAARDALVTTTEELPDTIEQLISAVEAEDVVNIVQHGSNLLAQCNDLIALFESLPDAIDAELPAFPDVTDAQFAEFAANFPRRLLDLLIVDQLDGVRALGASLTLLGLIERNNPYEGIDPNLIEFETVTIHYDRITKLLGQPAPYFEELYDWGTPAFDAIKLFPALYDFFARLGLPAAYHAPQQDRGPVFEAYVVTLTPDATLEPPGVAFTIEVPFGGSIEETAPLPHPAWEVHFKAEGTFTTEITGTWKPPLSFDLESPGAAFEGGAEVSLASSGPKPIVLLGKAGSSRLEVGAIRFGGGLSFTADSSTGQASAEPFVRGALESGRILVDASEGDGFISSILSGVKIDSNFDVGFEWSMATGIRFEGSAAIEIMLPVHIDLGPVSVSEIYLVAGLDGTDIPVELSASLGAHLGPLDVSVNRIGLITNIELTGSEGNAGPVQVDFDFKPPTSVGLSIDAQGIKGGGFLDIDRPNNRYVGMMQLEIQETIDVTAIGLITTELPGGEDGFSLMILISAEFQPIQLGLGFTLNGIGGLLGYNRTMAIDVLREGIRENSLKSILFPEDPVANAIQIISDLRAAFPPHDGQFVIGPMAKIGYGTPSFLTLEMGLVIELPDPIRVAILGVLKVILPEEESAIIKIQVNFIGTIDFEGGKFTFDASLFDSRLLTYDLSGDMAVRLFWKGEPQFLLSVGGFHPAFEPPPLDLPVLRRLALQLLKGDNPRLRLETYFAVSSNTVQFGARLELYAAAGPFNVYGFLGFDALFQFSPFNFIADIGAMLALRTGSSTVASISLSLTLEGTTPWKAKGTAKLKLFWFLTVKVRFSTTWGENRNTLLEDVAVLDRLVDALENKSNWQATLPGRSNLLVSLKEIAPIGDEVVVHPFGGLTISQKIVPLNVPIDKFGNAKPSDFNEFSIADHHAGGAPIHAGDIANSKDYFAPAQFFNKSDAQKLSADSFVKYDAGFALGTSEQLESSHYVKREVEYELKYIDSQRPVRFTIIPGLFVPLPILFNHFSKNGAVARSPLSRAAKRRSALAPEAVQLSQEGYAVTNLSDLKIAAGTTVLASEAEAFALMNQLQSEQPTLSGRLQVVPSFEINQDLAA